MTSDASGISGQLNVFVLVKSSAEREALRARVAGAGYAAVPAGSLAAAAALVREGADCRLAVIAADALAGGGERLGAFIVSCPRPPQLILCGIDLGSELALYCLSHGAVEFLASPPDPEELARALREAAERVDSPTGGGASLAVDRPVDGWIELTSPSELEQFRRFQRFSEALFRRRLSPGVGEDLQLALEEVSRNAIEWGNRFNPDKSLRVSYCLFSDRVVIKIEDEGEGFVPEEVPDPTIHPTRLIRERREAGKRPGGYGVFLIRKLVDRLDYSEKGNSVLLTKYLDPPEGD
ncbi:MAG: ATP-binding protein [Planctomycetota bacterium]|jgi:anti-sigma regulatory factor (Ser/Thr protein kinase)/CheY-like chemotaxis protein|nr:ATP-binding protein [Planctomycetota bacterium]